MPLILHSSDNPGRIESETRRKYSGAFYKPESIMRMVQDDGSDYFSWLLQRKMEAVRKYLDPHAPVLDLCCATGEHLFHLEHDRSLAVGVDFSLAFLKAAGRHDVSDRTTQPHFLCGNARRLPFSNEAFGMIYSFSSLYHIPKVDDVVSEIARILKPGGIAVLEFGNLWSLNTLVCRANKQTAQPCHCSLTEMKQALKKASLTVQEHQSFQLLPLWGDRPKWMRPLLHPVWKRLLEKRWRGKTIDGWLCRIPGIRYFAFRHLFVCRKGSML